MNRRIPLFALATAIRAAAVFGAGPNPEDTATVRAIVGGTLIDGTGAAAVPNARIVIRGGKIACAGATCEVPAGATVLDAKGMWITPGLVDAHVHFSQTGWADGRPDALDVRERYPYETTSAGLKKSSERFFGSYLCSGVTAVFDVGGYPWTVAMAARERDDPHAPHVAAAGPLLSTLDHWLNLPAERQFIHIKDPETARAGVRYLASIGSDAVKVWYIVSKDLPVEGSAPSVMAAGDEARKAGLPLIVHATGLDEAKVALKAGAKLLVHGVGDQPIDDEFLALAKANGATYCPTLTVLEGYRRMRDAAVTKKAPAVDDPNGCVDEATLRKVADTPSFAAPATWTPDAMATFAKRVADTERFGAANLKRVSDAGIPIAMGTDAGNPLTLHGPSVYAEMEAMEAAGMTPGQVLVASTRAGARAMGRDQDFGTVAAGKTADLLIVAADPARGIRAMRQLRYVVRGGVVHGLDELRAGPRNP